MIRAIRTTCQELATTLPVGFIVTPVMIQTLNISIIYPVIAWLATGLLGGISSLLTAIATGLPEVDK